MRKALRKKPSVTQRSPGFLSRVLVSYLKPWSLSQTALFRALSKSPGGCVRLCLEAVNDDVGCWSEGMPLGRLPALSSTLLTWSLLNGTLLSYWLVAVVLQSAHTAELKDACYFLSRLNQTRLRKSASSLTSTKRRLALAATRPTWHLSPR